MQPFRHHVILCTQQKPENVQCCSAGGSLATESALNASLERHGLSDDVLISTTGCLGTCENGPTMIVYPEGTWYGKVTADEVDEIVVSHLKDGHPVERLARKDEAEVRAESLDHRRKRRGKLAAQDKLGIVPEGAGITETIRSFMASRALLTALELDLFTAVGVGGTAEEMATRLHTGPRATEMLLHALAAMKLLEKHGDEFRNTPNAARFLAASSPDNARPALLHQADLWKSWSTLTDAVRADARVRNDVSHRDAESVRAFIAAMDRNARERAAQVVAAAGADFRRMLDLGGGSAAYSIAFAKAQPELTSHILDQADVVPLTREYIESAGLSARITARVGDMLRDDFGSGYDLVMLSAIAHMFSRAQNKALLGRIAQALAPGGKLILQDFILDPEKTSPLFAALFALNMLVNTEAGGTYSEEEYTEWMKEAGFRTVQRVRLPGPANLMIGEKR
ncbi:MAG: methyltransferase [Acidobacteriota bacterium]|nr:methyltransferase [Acidobacteriota bacterium]